MRYAESSFRIENVISKFMRSGGQEHVEIYLNQLLEGIKYNPEKKMQRSILCSWLCELQLGKITKLKSESEGIIAEIEKAQKQLITELYDKEIEKFNIFLEEYQNDLESETVFQLLQSHGRLNDCLLFSSLKKDYEMIALHYINKHDYKQAIEVINNIDKEKLRTKIMKKYISIFMKNEAKFTIECLPKYYEDINVDDLVASIISVDTKDRVLAANYISSVMEKYNSKLLHNLHLFFLAESNDPNCLKQLNIFLDQQEALHRANQPLSIDKDFALNVCKHANLIDAQIKLYATLDYYDECEIGRAHV